MQKTCGAIISYGKVPFIKDAIASLEPLRTYIINPFESWWSEDMEDYTAKQIKGLDVHLVRKSLANETDARNFVRRYALAEGYDLVVMIDTDEVLDGLDKLLDFTKKKDVDAYTCDIIDYAPDYKPLKPRNHKPIVAVKTENPTYKFYDKRCYECGWMENVPNVHILHYSFCIPEEFKYKKHKQNGDKFPPDCYRGVI